MVDPEWDPHDPYFSDQEYALLKKCGLLRERPEESRGQFVAGMHSNPCKYLQECGKWNLENVLTDHIIVYSVERKASTQMQPTETTDIVAK